MARERQRTRAGLGTCPRRRLGGPVAWKRLSQMVKGMQIAHHTLLAISNLGSGGRLKTLSVTWAFLCDHVYPCKKGAPEQRTRITSTFERKRRLCLRVDGSFAVRRIIGWRFSCSGGRQSSERLLLPIIFGLGVDITRYGKAQSPY